ncbi:MAG TPA: hypothetical protein VFA67_08575 [Candidatus Sulfotelmatobacter sp.]|nr:hypothetical protein [Candidatus Sulfotelmatobacter sp.]
MPAKSSRGSAKALVSRFVPKSLLKELQTYRSFKENHRPIYLKLRLLDLMGMGNGKRKAPPSARSLLFVCFGNRMRSPMCEALIIQELGRQRDDFKIRSAGLHAETGNTAHHWAIAAAPEFGIALEPHRAALLTPEMVSSADAIFAMDYHNEVELVATYPEARGKIFMLGAYAGDSYPDVEIADPYHGTPEQTRDCYRILQRCIRQLASEVLADVRPAASGGRAPVAGDVSIDS